MFKSRDRPVGISAMLAGDEFRRAGLMQMGTGFFCSVARKHASSRSGCELIPPGKTSAWQPVSFASTSYRSPESVNGVNSRRSC